jgi:dipeptide/tripeptide permease
VAQVAPVPETRPPGLWQQLSGLQRAFWMVNTIEMFERLAYYGVRVVIPIYIAQADEPGGLHFTQDQKGMIFALWALVQTGVPIFSGGFADRYGYKRTIATSLAISITGYLLMASQRSFWGFTAGCLTLALGTAIFKPGLQGTLVRTLNERTSSIGWGTFYMVVNIGGFLGPPFAHFMKHNLSWPMVFVGSACILSINYLMLLTYKEVPSGTVSQGGPLEVAKTTFRNILKPKLLTFILIMSGFWVMFMQLFDMLPNFIVDWIDSRPVVQALNLPGMFTTATPRGTMVAQEWMINLDAGLIVLLVVALSALVARMKRVQSIFIGIVIASLGLVMAGFTMSGWICLAGIAVFAIGEMLASPKMNEYLGVIAPEGQKALYMGYANMPFAIGWTYGSIAGGKMYDRMGDKANLALRYMNEHGISTAGVARTDAMEALQRAVNMDAVQATNLLWTTYHPSQLWVPFMLVGLGSALGIWLYSLWIRKDVGANA